MAKHTWNFSTIGGVKRVNLESGEDLKHLKHLDQKLWAVLSCPVNGLEFDEKTLSLIDTNQDGSVQVPEIIEAVDWALSLTAEPDLLLQSTESVKLSEINTQTEAGKILYESAKSMLKALGKPDSDTLTFDQSQQTEAIFKGMEWNGDGIITEHNLPREELKEVFDSILNSILHDENKDRSGDKGLEELDILNFFSDCESYLEWRASQNEEAVFIFKERTQSLYEIYEDLWLPLEDYFTQCELLRYNPNLITNSDENVINVSNWKMIQKRQELLDLPIAKVTPDSTIRFREGINPGYKDKMELFAREIVQPLTGQSDLLTFEQYTRIKKAFDPYADWNLYHITVHKSMPTDLELVRKFTSQNYMNELLELTRQDAAHAVVADAVYDVQKWVRFRRDLIRILNNFVTLSDFYNHSDSIFQSGTLYIDQRSCNLCIRVTDDAKHRDMAAFSGMFLLYCDCVSKNTSEKMTIVAALTSGDIANLTVGRNALFYDKKGMIWDATVVRIVDHPISIKQAFWSPYRKISGFISKQFQRFASEQDDKVQQQATKQIESVPMKTADEKAPAPPAPFDIGKFVGIFAAIGLAIGAIGSVIASFISGFLGLVWWKMPFALAGILLVISGPSMILAYFKLRSRNLTPLLNANGWAINANIIVNIPFGNTFTFEAELPEGAQLNLNDPFLKKKTPLYVYLIVLTVLSALLVYILWKLGYMHL